MSPLWKMMNDFPYVQLVYGLYGLVVLAGLAVFLSFVAHAVKNAIVTGSPGSDFRKSLRSGAAWLAARPFSWHFAGRLLLALLVLQFVGVLIGRGAAAFGLVTDGELESSWVIVQGVIFHLAGIIIVLVLLRRSGTTWSSAFGANSGGFVRQAGRGAVLYLAFLPVFLVITIAYHALLRAAGIELSMQDVVSVFLAPQSPVTMALHLFLAAVAAPVAEELLFRGILLPLLARGMGAPRAVLLGAFLFSAMHLHLPSLVPLFVLAAALSLAYIRSRNIVVPIMMHVLFNSVNLAFLVMLSGEEIWQ